MSGLEKITTGIKPLDEILEGGIPRGSVNIISGAPGTGKTILTQQVLFANADQGNKALYFATVSESSMKMLKYQQQFSFFDSEKVGKSVFFVDIGKTIEEKGLREALDKIIDNIQEHNPIIVAIDSFKAIHDLASCEHEFRAFIYELAVKLSVMETTSFLIGEYTLEQGKMEPEFAVVDGIIHLEGINPPQQPDRLMMIKKMRGTGFQKGWHAYRISKEGIVPFPRYQPRISAYRGLPDVAMKRVKIGIAGLDEMLGGGLVEGFAAMVAGSAGTGKTTLGLQFLVEGISRGERGLLISYEERPAKIVKLAHGYGIDLSRMIKEKKVMILHRPPVELGVDEFLLEIKQAVDTFKPRRAVVDSLTDLHLTIAEPIRLRDYVYSMADIFDQKGVTLILNNEVPELFGQFKLTSGSLSVIVDCVIFMRYVEIVGRIEKALAVLKMRGSEHDKEIHKYHITNYGLVVGETFKGQEGLMGGTPTTVDKEFEELIKKMR